MAMPSEYNEDIAERICEQLADGDFLRAVCARDGMPNWRTVYKWMDQYPEFHARVRKAREIGHDAILEDTLIIADESTFDTIETEKGSRINSEWVQRSKLRIETRFRALSKWNPKKFGDKLDHTSSDGSMSPKEPVTAIEIVSPEFKAPDDDSQAD